MLECASFAVVMCACVLQLRVHVVAPREESGLAMSGRGK